MATGQTKKPKTYTQGMLDGVQLWGTVCGKESSCSECPVVGALQAGMTCQEFARKNPSKFISILREMNGSNHTYANEFALRFPSANLPIDILPDVVCRKAVFEGYTACEGGDCKACWLEKFEGDVTVEEEQEKDTKGFTTDILEQE